MALRAAPALEAVFDPAVPCSAVVGYCRYSPDGVLLWASASVAAVTGKPVVALVGSRVRELVHPQDLGGWDAAFAGLVAGGQPYTIELRAQHGDGSWHWFAATVWGSFDAPGQLARIFRQAVSPAGSGLAGSVVSDSAVRV